MLLPRPGLATEHVGLGLAVDDLPGHRALTAQSGSKLVVLFGSVLISWQIGRRAELFRYNFSSN